MFPISVVTKSSALVTMTMLKAISSHSVVLSMVPNVLMNAQINQPKLQESYQIDRTKLQRLPQSHEAPKDWEQDFLHATRVRYERDDPFVRTILELVAAV